MQHLGNQCHHFAALGSGILAEEAQGWRALYVALTRATKLLTIVHTSELPAVLAPAADRL